MDVPGANVGRVVTGRVSKRSPATWKGIKMTKHTYVFNIGVTILPFETQVFENCFLHRTE